MNNQIFFKNDFKATSRWRFSSKPTVLLVSFSLYNYLCNNVAFTLIILNFTTGRRFFVHTLGVIEDGGAPMGDRMNKLVIIGQEMDKEKMIADLENCLLQNNG